MRDHDLRGYSEPRKPPVAREGFRLPERTRAQRPAKPRPREDQARPRPADRFAQSNYSWCACGSPRLDSVPRRSVMQTAALSQPMNAAEGSTFRISRAFHSSSASFLRPLGNLFAEMGRRDGGRLLGLAGCNPFCFAKTCHAIKHVWFCVCRLRTAVQPHSGALVGPAEQRELKARVLCERSRPSHSFGHVVSARALRRGQGRPLCRGFALTPPGSAAPTPVVLGKVIGSPSQLRIAR